MRRGASTLCALLLWAPAVLAADVPPPRRIVSLNLCADQILVALAPRARIAAVTHLAADPALSPAAAAARGLPVTRGWVEDVIARDPDLVLAAEYAGTATVDLLRRLGRRVEVLELAQDIAGVRRLVRRVGGLIGAEAKAEIWLADFDARLAAVTAERPNGRAPSAVIYQVNNFASGAGGIADAALAAAGFRNLAPELGVSSIGQVALETLVVAPPDLLIVTSDPAAYRTVVGDNLRHPALRAAAGRRPMLVLDWSYLLCGTPHVIGAIEQLAAARATLGAGGTR